MQIIKKYGLLILCVIALIALFLPMATISIESDYVDYVDTVSVSGFKVAFKGYISLLLIVAPVLLIASDYVPKFKARKKLIMLIAPIVCIVVTFIAYLQSAGIAGMAENGYAERNASIGIGGILCILAYIGIGILGFLENKDEILALAKKNK